MLKRTGATSLASPDQACVDLITRMRGVSAERPMPHTNTACRDCLIGRMVLLAFIPWAGASYSEPSCLRECWM